MEGIPLKTGVRSAGPLPHLPDAPGAFLLVCAFMGDTDRRLGEVLYVGMADDVRRRVGAILAGTSAPGAQLLAFQRAGGEVDVVVAPGAAKGAAVEAALLHEFVHRSGDVPAWSKGVPKKRPDAASTREAERILDALNVRPR